MAICTLCSREMLDHVSCVTTPLLTTDGVFDPVPYGMERRRPLPGRCGDCGTPRGGFHHRGCDLEECPRCRRQLLMCGCDTEDGDLDECDDLDDGDGLDDLDDLDDCDCPDCRPRPAPWQWIRFFSGS